MAAMKLMVLAACATQMAAAASFLRAIRTKGACGPQTQVCVASVFSAASEPQWECAAAVDGESVVIKDSESENNAVICGPGKFHFSPMQCAGGRFDYKKQVVKVETSASSGNDCPGGGQSVSFPYGMHCYMVEC